MLPGVHSAGIVVSAGVRYREHVDSVDETPPSGATGFDMIRSRKEAGRGLLTSLNRGKDASSVDNNYALAA
jgi:hypothetical protein